MVSELCDSWLPISPEDLRGFEARVGLDLPKDYMSFLLAMNGGNGGADALEFGEGSIQSIYGLNTGFRYADLDWKFDIFTKQKRMPSSCVPIACDPGGNQYVLVCDGQRQGEVWFWDHDNEPSTRASDNRKFDRMSKCERSFTAFFQAIRLKKESKSAHPDPAFRAVQQGELEALLKMLDAGLDCNHRGKEDYLAWATLLAMAVHYGRLKVITALLDRGADLTLPDANGNPPIFYACQGVQSSDALNMLLQLGVSPNQKSASGVPLLVHAAHWEAAKVVRWLLLRDDIDINAVDTGGKKAIDIAIEAGDECMVRLLEQHR